MASINIKYSSFAVAPEGISLTKTYQFKNVDGETYIIDKGKELKMPVEEIRMLFEPLESDWDTILETKKTSKKTEKDKVEA